MAFTVNLLVEAGATFTREITYTNPDGTVFDLTDYTAELQVRETVASSTAAITLNPSINVSTGVISWTFTATQTASLTADKYVWAIELEHTDGTVLRFVEGDITVKPEVVR
jgi:hypothetical protein